jgi:hypothetical protein
MKKQLGILFNSTLHFAIFSVVLVAAAVGQNNPIPQIVGPVHPEAIVPGRGAFTLSVYGANFIPGSVVNWNYQPRVTSYISGHELQAQILASDVEKNTAGFITVTNPSPGGGDSSASWAQVEVHDPVSTVTLSSPQYYFFGTWITLPADFNHDAIIDILGEYGTGLGLELGDGNGRFRPQSLAGRHNAADTQVAYGDFTGSGNLDVLYVPERAGDFHTQTHVRLMLNDGKGNLSQGPTTTSRNYFYSLVVADFNRDGKLDFMTAGDYVSTFIGKGDGTFTQFASYPYTTLAYEMVAGDFNGDGKLDLVFFQPDAQGRTGLAMWFVEGNGDGTLQLPKQIVSVPNQGYCVGGGFQYGLQLSDVNNDGILDLAFCDNSQIGVMLGNGDGTFQPPSYYTTDPTGQGLFTFAIGDINSDGNEDLIVSEYNDYSDPTLVVFLGNGDGSFQAPQTTNVTAPGLPEEGITVGDLNSDGLLDVIYQIQGIDVFLNTSTH